MHHCLSELFIPPTHKDVVFCFWPEWTPYLSMNFSWCWLYFTPLLWGTPTPCSPQRSAFLWRSGCCTSTISVSVIPLEPCSLPSSICPVPVHPRVSSFHLHNKKLLNLSALQNKLTSIGLKFYMKFYLFMLQFLLLLVKFWEFLAMCFHLDSSPLLLPYLPHLFMSQICFLFFLNFIAHWLQFVLPIYSWL